MNITITIPAQFEQEVLDAFTNTYGLSPTMTDAEKWDFIRDKLRDAIRTRVLNLRVKIAEEEVRGRPLP